MFTSAVVSVVSIVLAASAALNPPPAPTLLPSQRSGTPERAEPFVYDPHIAEVGRCYWRELGPQGQEEQVRRSALGGLKVLLVIVDQRPIPKCDPNFSRHFEATIWIIRARLMREVALRRLAAVNVPESKLETKLIDVPTLATVTHDAAERMVRSGEFSIDVQDFGFSPMDETRADSGESYVDRYLAYYYIGRAIEDVIVEHMSDTKLSNRP